jgi:hypothetical protein
MSAKSHLNRAKKLLVQLRRELDQASVILSDDSNVPIKRCWIEANKLYERVERVQPELLKDGYKAIHAYLIDIKKRDHSNHYRWLPDKASTFAHYVRQFRSASGMPQHRVVKGQ